MYAGSYKIDDNFTFYAQTQAADGGSVDGDSAPTYRVYEDETGTPILTGTMALLDAANTAGLYSEQIALSAANGFEKGKCYCIRLSATVAAIVGATLRFVQIQAEVAVASVNANAITSTAIATGSLTAAKFAAGAIDGAALAADAGAEIGTAVWASATRLLTAGTNIVLAKGTGVTGFNDIAAGDAMTLTGAYDFAKGTVAMTEAYAANGVAPTPVQAFYAIQQMLTMFGIAGTSLTVKKLDNATTAFIVTLNSATTPTAAART